MNIAVSSISILLALLSCPMILGRVPRNSAFGFRTRKTLSSDELWRKGNRRAGYGLLASSVCTYTASIVGGLISESGDIWSLIGVAMLLVTVCLAFIDSALALRRMSEEGAVDVYALGRNGVVSVSAAVTGFTLAIIAIPLIRRDVPPNGLLGIRTTKSLSSPEIWYSANEVMGGDLFLVGLIMGLVSMASLLPRVPRWAKDWRFVGGLSLALLAGAFVHSMLYLEGA